MIALFPAQTVIASEYFLEAAVGPLVRLVESAGALMIFAGAVLAPAWHAVGSDRRSLIEL